MHGFFCLQTLVIVHQLGGKILEKCLTHEENITYTSLEPSRFLRVRRGYLSPHPTLFSNNLPLLWFPHLKKSLIPPFPISFFQTLNVVMLIASTKSRIARGTSHQPAVMVSCLLVMRVCPVYQEKGLVISGRVSQCLPDFTDMGSCYYSRKWVWSSRIKLCCMASGK